MRMSRGNTLSLMAAMAALGSASPNMFAPLPDCKPKRQIDFDPAVKSEIRDWNKEVERRNAEKKARKVKS